MAPPFAHSPERAGPVVPHSNVHDAKHAGWGGA